MKKDRPKDQPITAVLLDPRALRASSIMNVDLGDGVFVKARKVDMAAMVFEGLLPMPLLSAVQAMIEMRGASPEERVAEMTRDNNGQNMLTLLRKHACVAVLEPKVVETDNGNENTIPVELLTLQQLSAIWAATAVIPMMEPAAAARFRPQPSPVVAHAPQHGTDLPPAAKPVDSSPVEFRHA